MYRKKILATGGTAGGLKNHPRLFADFIGDAYKNYFPKKYVPFYNWLMKRKITFAFTWEYTKGEGWDGEEAVPELEIYHLYITVTDPEDAMLAKLMWK